MHKLIEWLECTLNLLMSATILWITAYMVYVLLLFIEKTIDRNLKSDK